MDMLNIHQLPLQCSALFALRQSAVDLMMFQTIDWNEQTSQELDFRLITISKNNLSQWNSHIPANAFKIPSLCHYGSCQNIFTRKVTDMAFTCDFCNNHSHWFPHPCIWLPVSLSHTSPGPTLDVPKSLVSGPQVPSPHTRIPMSLSPCPCPSFIQNVHSLCVVMGCWDTGTLSPYHVPIVGWILLP